MNKRNQLCTILFLSLAIPCLSFFTGCSSPSEDLTSASQSSAEAVATPLPESQEEEHTGEGKPKDDNTSGQPSSEQPFPEPSTPELSEPLAVFSEAEIKVELAEAIRQLRQPRKLILSGFDLKQPELDIKNIYYEIIAEQPELKYAYDLTTELCDSDLTCQISYMPYKTGEFPSDFEGREIFSPRELIAVAEENLGEQPTLIRITNANLEPDIMNRALQQAGGGYILCSLNTDATEILYSAPIGLTMEECLSALESAEQLADAVIAQLITEDMTQREKAKTLYSYVTQTVAYDQSYYSQRDIISYESQTALGALQNGLAICGGYSHVVKLLFEKVGIPCFNVTGRYFQENHMWNIALIDGEWLWFDATTDRGSTGEFGFLRFALTELDKTKYKWNEEQVKPLLE